jgi:hypothetical protein
MAEQKTNEGDVRVRNVRTQAQGKDLFGSLLEGGNTLVRMGLGLLTLPLTILPPEPRQQVRQTIHDIMLALISLPRELAEVATTAIEEWATETNETPVAGKK